MKLEIMVPRRRAAGALKHHNLSEAHRIVSQTLSSWEPEVAVHGPEKHT